HARARAVLPGESAGESATRRRHRSGVDRNRRRCVLRRGRAVGRNLTLTGSLGEVMQESAKAAHTYIWSHCGELALDRSRFRKAGVHIHVPARAVAKDGPSAGVTMVSALTSLFVGHPVRSDTAMTGEITLTGL